MSSNVAVLKLELRSNVGRQCGMVASNTPQQARDRRHFYQGGSLPQAAALPQTLGGVGLVSQPHGPSPRWPYSSYPAKRPHFPIPPPQSSRLTKVFFGEIKKKWGVESGEWVNAAPPVRIPNRLRLSKLPLHAQYALRCLTPHQSVITRIFKSSQSDQLAM